MGQKQVGWALFWPVGEELDQTDWAKEVGTAWICVGEPVAEQFGGGGLKLCGFWAVRPLSSLSKSTGCQDLALPKNCPNPRLFRRDPAHPWTLVRFYPWIGPAHAQRCSVLAGLTGDWPEG